MGAENVRDNYSKARVVQLVLVGEVKMRCGGFEPQAMPSGRSFLYGSGGYDLISPQRDADFHVQLHLHHRLASSTQMYSYTARLEYRRKMQ